jgi:hypothetical protein
MLQAGFHRAKLAGYTGFKSSPYTEGALFYGEKLLDATARNTNAARAGRAEIGRELL